MMGALEDLLRVLGVIVGIVVAALGGIKVWKEARTASSSAQITALQAAADEWRELKEDYRGRLETAEARLDALEQEKRTLRTDVDTLRETESLLVRWLRKIRHGVEGGTIPPWPTDPSWLTELEQRYGRD